PEPLGADDNELVVSVQVQEGVDLGRSVQERVVEIFGDADIVGVHSPGSHTISLGRDYSIIPTQGLSSTAAALRLRRPQPVKPTDFRPRDGVHRADRPVGQLVQSSVHPSYTG